MAHQPTRNTASEVEATIRHAIDAVADPQIGRGLLGQALYMAGAAAVPEGGAALRVFVEAHLGPAAENAVGAAKAQRLLESLSPLVDAIGDDEPISGVRISAVRKAVEARSERPATATATGLVVLATRDEDAASQLSAALADVTTVVRILDAFELLDQLTAERAPPVVVIDCRIPAIQPATVLAVAPDVREGTSVVLWGASEELQKGISKLRHCEGAWVCCADGTNDEALATLCRSLVDELV